MPFTTTIFYGVGQRVDVVGLTNQISIASAQIVWDALQAAGFNMHSARP